MGDWEKLEEFADGPTDQSGQIAASVSASLAEARRVVDAELDAEDEGDAAVANSQEGNLVIVDRLEEGEIPECSLAEPANPLSQLNISANEVRDNAVDAGEINAE